MPKNKYTFTVTIRTFGLELMVEKKFTNCEVEFRGNFLFVVDSESRVAGIYTTKNCHVSIERAD